MNRQKYEKLLASDEVIKLKKHYNSHNAQGNYYQLRAGSFITSFYFIHGGFNDNLTKRVHLKVFEKFNPNIPFKIIASRVNKSTLMMVNSYSPDYAFTFRLIINQENKFSSLQIEDLPELGKGIISKRELEGIKVSLVA